ncbi:mitotic-spindle organizing protein 2A-like isoform X2 [Sphaerodactylus townsendi]|uniref:mitotic-spindle organizing protein 2A-like isoform X2 n=1 Tax=Sphaerodactylus townsendi TaxID=933632 RepID=UPI0020267EF6|nr:mitotic-spindle organizing protein 2A-like isoform X2 [Sphaerodactylus townsendi]
MSGPSLETTGPVKAGAVGGSRSRRKLLTTEEGELFELAQAAGTSIDPEVFKILLDLLRMNVAPAAIFQMLRSMCAGQRLAAEGAPELAREPQLISAKTSKIPAPLSLSSALRPPRIRVTKAGVYGPAAACSPLSQGRTKTGSATAGPQTLSDHSSREGSSQRVPRQPSASRLQKTGKST